MAERMVDFEKVKTQVPIRLFIEKVHDGALVDLTEHEDGMKGFCPIHGGGHFNVSFSKNCWSCRHSDDEDNSSGNVIELAAALYQLSAKKAALKIADMFELTDVNYVKGKRGNGTPKEDAPEIDVETPAQLVLPDSFNMQFSLKEANQRVLTGDLNEGDLIVINVPAFNFLQEAINQERPS